MVHKVGLKAYQAKGHGRVGTVESAPATRCNMCNFKEEKLYGVHKDLKLCLSQKEKHGLEKQAKVKLCGTT